MRRSFQIVRYKIEETDFFLSKLYESTDNIVPIDASHYLSAFFTSARSITFVLQASLSHLPNFEIWYNAHQQNLRESKLAKYFVEARNYSQKVGYYPLTGFRYYYDINGKKRMEYHFDHSEKDLEEFVPEEDIISSCKKYFILLLEVIYDAYQVFSKDIECEHYLIFIDNYKKRGKTIEDIEEEFGFPRGYTNLNGITEEERIRQLYQQSGMHIHDNVDKYFAKYLRRTRFGVTIK